MLHLDHISVSYGDVWALDDVTLDVSEGEIVALIGANGAGKSTTLKTISGLLHPRQGTIDFKDRRIDHLSPESIVSLGLSQVPEGRRVFPGLTVLENLEVGASAWKGWRNTDIGQDLERVYGLFPQLKARTSQRAWSLSGGEQQMLAIGRALMARPKLLLMDEPSMGLSPILVQTLCDTIKDIHRTGTTVLLVEQNAYMALRIADRGYVLETGRIVLQAKTADLLQNEKVKEAYLGT